MAAFIREAIENELRRHGVRDVEDLPKKTQSPASPEKMQRRLLEMAYMQGHFNGRNNLSAKTEWAGPFLSEFERGYRNGQQLRLTAKD